MPVSCPLTLGDQLGSCGTIEGPNSQSHVARCNIKVDEQSYSSFLRCSFWFIFRFILVRTTCLGSMSCRVPRATMKGDSSDGFYNKCFHTSQL